MIVSILIALFLFFVVAPIAIQLFFMFPRTVLVIGALITFGVFA